MTNAVDAAGFAFNGVEQTWLVAQYPPVIADFVTRFNQRDIPFSSCGGKTTFHLRHVDNDANSVVSVGDVLKYEYPKCDPYTIDLSLSVTSVTLTNGQLAALSGNAAFDLTVELPASTQQIQSASTAADASGLHAVGTFKLAYTATLPNPPTSSNSRRWQITDLAVTLTSGGTVETLSGGVLDKNIDAANHYKVSVSGAIDSQRLGTTIAFSTPTPSEGTVGLFPATGEILITSGASKVRLTPTSDTSLGNDYADVAIDATGAGYGARQPMQWLDFLRGGLFGWYPNDPPVIRSLTILPADPTKATDLSAVFLVTDRENDPVQTELEWRRNGVLIANQTQSTLSSANFAKGDEVTVTLTVRDLRGRATRTAVTTIRNAKPLLSDVAIAPANPVAVDDLTFGGRASDADGDPLTVVFAWKRNGAVIPNQTGRTLSATFTSTGDTILASITADDGTGPVSAEAAASIADSPAQITLRFVPTSVAYGTHVQFDADAVDPDEPNVALRLKLNHGPEGMTIDPVSGQVTWDAAPPMFDRALDVHFGVGVEGDPTVATGTITVDDPTRSYALMRTGTEIPLWPAGLSVGDFDGAGGAEVMVLSRRSLYELKADGAGGYRQSWMYPFALGSDATDSNYSYYSPNNMSALTTGDSDGDGKHEIFVAAGHGVFKLDGVSRRVVTSKTLATDSRCSDLQFANLDGVGESEIVCLLQTGSFTSSGMVVLGANDLAVKWTFPNADYGYSIDVGNVDADSKLEIVTGKGYVFDGGTFANEWLYGPGFGRDVDTGDLDGDGIDEIVAVSGPLRGYSAMLRSPLWEAPGRGDSLLVTNVDGDAAKEIVVGDDQWGNVTAYDYDVQHNTVAIAFQSNSQDHGVTSIGVGDIDHDGRLELIWGSGATSSGADRLVVAGRNPPANEFGVEWINENPIQLDGPFVGGQLAGTSQLPRAPLFSSPRTNSGYAGARLIRMDPTSGDLTISAEVGSNWNGQAAFTVSDYDNDGVDEVFLATSVLYDGYLTAYDFFGGSAQWTAPKLPIQQYIVAVERADITNDGHDDLVAISSTGVVFVHDVFAQTLVWQSTTLGYSRDVLVADLDEDGSLDIVAVTNDGLYVYERIAGPITYVQTASLSRPDTRDAVVLDFDGDGDLEVVLLAGNRVERLDHNLQPLGAFGVAWRSESLTVEPSTSLRKNLILPVQDYTPLSSIVAVDSMTGAEVWRSPNLIGSVSRDGVQFVTIGGQRRLSFGTNAGMYLTR